MIFEVSISIVNPHRRDPARTEQQMRICYEAEPNDAARLAHAWGHERTLSMRIFEDNKSLFLGSVKVHLWVPKRPEPDGHIQQERSPFRFYEWKHDWGTPEPEPFTDQSSAVDHGQ